MPRVSEEEQREVREVRQKVANGDVYVYEVTYERDPETSRRVQVAKRTLGIYAPCRTNVSWSATILWVCQTTKRPGNPEPLLQRSDFDLIRRRASPRAA